jgi:hypothetical protein
MVPKKIASKQGLYQILEESFNADYESDGDVPNKKGLGLDDS